MLERPEDLPERWGSSGERGTTPPVQTQRKGFTFRFAPSFQLLNWLFGTLTDWVRHFADRMSVFPSLESAWKALPEGGTAFVDEGGAAFVETGSWEHGVTGFELTGGRFIATGRLLVSLFAKAGKSPGDPNAFEIRVFDRETLAELALIVPNGRASIIPGFAVSEEGVILLRTHNTAEAWDLKGNLLWRHEGLIVASMFAAFTAPGGRLFYSIGTSVRGVDAMTGDTIFTKDLAAENVVTGAYRNDDCLYVVEGTAGVYNLHKVTLGGDVVWTEPVPGTGFTEPLTSDDRIYVAAPVLGGNSSVRAFDPRDGSELWAVTFTNREIFSFTKDRDFLYVLLADPDAEVVRLDPRTGAVLESTEGLGLPAVDGTALWFVDSTRFHRLSKGTGMRLFRKKGVWMIPA